MYSSRVMTVASIIGSSIFGDLARIRELRRIIDLQNLVLRIGDAVTNARRGRNQVDVEFPLQPFLHDLEMQQAEEAAAEAKAQRDRILRLEAHRAVVQAELFQRIAQQTVLVRFHRIQSREHHRLDLFEAG